MTSRRSALRRAFATPLVGVVLVVVAAQKPGQRGPATCTTTSRGDGGWMMTPLPARSAKTPDLHRSSPLEKIPASKNCWRSPTWRWCPTNCPAPARSCPCCRSCLPRATKNACCWWTRNSRASWPPSSPGYAQATAVLPLVARYDHHERVTGPLLPHLFQRARGARREVISPGTVYKLINTALAAAGLKDATGQPLVYRPHDFRRCFTTRRAARAHRGAAARPQEPDNHGNRQRPSSRKI